MTRDQIIDSVLRRLGNRENDMVLRAAAESEILLVQTTLEEEPEPPWFLLSERSVAATVALEPRLPLPCDFLLEWEDGTLYILDPESGDENALKKDFYDDLKEKYKGEAPGVPKEYATRNKYFWLFPTPADIYIMYVTYFKAASPLDTAEAENDWSIYAPDLLIGELGLLMARGYTRDEGAATAFETDVVRARNRIAAKRIAREMANFEAMMGD